MRALLLGSLLLLLSGCSTADAGDTPDAGLPEEPGLPSPRTACAGLTLSAGDSVRTLQHQGRTRSYRLHVPAGYVATRPTPVLLAFHGFGSDAAEQEGLSRLSALADAQGFLAVYPLGLDGPEVGIGFSGVRGWNAGSCCGAAQRANADDVGFVDALLEDLAAATCSDPQRVYATGLSTGGFFSYRLACERSRRIAAIAPVAGMRAFSPCTPARAVPVLHFHGTADEVSAYDGGNGGFGVGAYPSAPASVQAAAGANGCGGPLEQTYQRGDSTCRTYTGCAAPAGLCTVDGGGHNWPGGLVPERSPFGRTTRDLDASAEMWRFFQRFTLPAP